MKNGNGGKGLARDERLQIMLSPDELKALDNFRFEHRMPSRAAAVRELLRQGLGVTTDVVDNTGITSGEYGVLKKPKGLGSARNSQLVKAAFGGTADFGGLRRGHFWKNIHRNNPSGVGG